jgi:hypothetical protein
MSEPIQLGRIPIIRFQGIFDFDKLYKLMVKWFEDRNYIFNEPVYKDKPMTLGREVEIEWKGEKKITSFYKENIEIAFHLWDMQPVEVIQEGEKKMLTKARMEVVLKGYLEADYQNRWESSEWMKIMRSFYLKHVVSRSIGGLYWDPLYYRVYALHTMIKNELNLDTKGSAY